MPEDLDAIADALYALPPEEFVPARDDQVATARERGDRELAKAIGRLRRPTRPAWLANLLARHRAAQLDGLISLAAGLAEAQRTLDGAQLRTLTTQRHRAVAAMAREAGRLAQDAGSPATDAQLRELQGILEAALAQPDVARQVKEGRLTRTLSYTGFGPESDPDAVPVPAPRAAPREEPREEPPPDDSERRAAERRREEERARRRQALEEAEREAEDAREQQESDEAARDEAREQHAEARDRVARLTAELEAARDAERRAGEDERKAAGALRESTRAANAATAAVERARARLDEVS